VFVCARLRLRLSDWFVNRVFFGLRWVYFVAGFEISVGSRFACECRAWNRNFSWRFFRFWTMACTMAASMAPALPSLPELRTSCDQTTCLCASPTLSFRRNVRRQQFADSVHFRSHSVRPRNLLRNFRIEFVRFRAFLWWSGLGFVWIGCGVDIWSEHQLSEGETSKPADCCRICLPWSTRSASPNSGRYANCAHFTFQLRR